MNIEANNDDADDSDDPEDSEESQEVFIDTSETESEGIFAEADILSVSTIDSLNDEDEWRTLLIAVYLNHLSLPD